MKESATPSPPTSFPALHSLTHGVVFKRGGKLPSPDSVWPYKMQKWDTYQKDKNLHFSISAQINNKQIIVHDMSIMLHKITLIYQPNLPLYIKKK